MINSVTVVGRLTRDPEVRTVGNDLKVCQFTLASDKKGKDKGTNFFDCIAWGKAGEVIEQYVKKGEQFGVSGRLDQQTWEKDGAKHSKINIIVEEFVFLGNKNTNSVESKPQKDGSDIDLGDVPF